MTIELALVISAISLGFAIYQGVSNLKRNERQENKTEAAQTTAVIVKLESISEGVNEIKADIRGVKNEMNDFRERLTKAEESTKSSHRRIDTIEGKIQER